MKTRKVAVTVYEVHAATYEVEVEDEPGDGPHRDSIIHERAIKKANELIEAGEEPVSFDYNHTLDEDQWASTIIN